MIMNTYNFVVSIIAADVPAPLGAGTGNNDSVGYRAI